MLFIFMLVVSMASCLTVQAASISPSLGVLSAQLTSLVDAIKPFDLGGVTQEQVAEAAKLARGAKYESIKAAESLKKKNYDKAVIVVDIQYDFCELPFEGHANGALAVKGTGLKYTTAALEYIDAARKANYLIIFTQDFHPQNHVSFFSRWQGRVDNEGRSAEIFKPFNIPIQNGTKNQYLWPNHCMQGTPGADLVIKPKEVDLVVKKGMNLNFDSYSGFEGRDNITTGLAAILELLGVKELVVIGIATDYCVQYTVIDALKLGKYEVTVVVNLCRGVAPDSTITALQEMQTAKYPALKGRGTNNKAHLAWLENIEAADKTINKDQGEDLLKRLKEFKPRDMLMPS